MASVFQPDLGTPAVIAERSIPSPTASAVRGVGQLLTGLATDIRKEGIRKDIGKVTEGVELVLGNLRDQSPLPPAATRELQKLAALGVSGRSAEMGVRLSALKGRLRESGIADDLIAFGFKQAGLVDPELQLTQLIIEEETQSRETQRKLKESVVQDTIRANPSLAVLDNAGNIDVQGTFDATRRRELNAQAVINSFEQDIAKVTNALNATTMDTYVVAATNLQIELFKETPDMEKVTLLINDMVRLKGEADVMVARAKLGRSQEDIKQIEDRIAGPLNTMFSRLTGSGDDLTILKANATINLVMADANRRGLRNTAPSISRLADFLGADVAGRILGLDKNLRAMIDASKVFTEEFTNILTITGAPDQVKTTKDDAVPEVGGDADTAQTSLDALRTITGDLSNIKEDVKVSMNENGTEMSAFSTYASAVMGNSALRSQMDARDAEQFFNLLTSDGFRSAMQEQAKVSPALAEGLQRNLVKTAVDIYARVLTNAINSGDIPPQLSGEPVLQVNVGTGSIQINKALLDKIDPDRIVRLGDRFVVRDRPGSNELRKVPGILNRIGELNTMLQNFKAVTGRSGKSLIAFIQATLPTVEVSDSE